MINNVGLSATNVVEKVTAKVKPLNINMLPTGEQIKKLSNTVLGRDLLYRKTLGLTVLLAPLPAIAAIAAYQTSNLSHSPIAQKNPKKALNKNYPVGRMLADGQRLDFGNYKTEGQLIQNFGEEAAELEKKFTDMSARTDTGKEKRDEILQEWTKAVTIYPSDIQLMIMKDITAGLKKDNDKLPPVLDIKKLDEVVHNTVNTLKEQKKFAPVSFINLYNKAISNPLFEKYAEDDFDMTSQTGWLKIPCAKNTNKKVDEEGETRINDLKILSSKTWCTSVNMAEEYLSEGDFMIYYENGKPQIGVRFAGKHIAEIQGVRNDSTIPLDYLDIVKQKFEIKTDNDEVTSNVPLSSATKKELTSALKMLEYKNILNKLTEEEKKDIKTVLEKIGIKTQTGEDGKIVIHCLKNYFEDLKNYFEDLNIANLEGFENIIVRSVYLNAVNPQKLRNLRHISGDITLPEGFNYEQLETFNYIDLKELKKKINDKTLSAEDANEIFRKLNIETKISGDMLGLYNVKNPEYFNKIPALSKLFEFVSYSFNCDLSKIDPKLLSNLKKIFGHCRYLPEGFDYSQLESVANCDLRKIDPKLLSNLKEMWGEVKLPEGFKWDNVKKLYYRTLTPEQRQKLNDAGCTDSDEALKLIIEAA